MAEFPLQMLRDLKQDWDSYGARPLEESLIQKAYELWRCLPGPWSVVPMSNGGIQLSRYADGFEIDICIERPAQPQTGDAK